ncbi:hypothetical protein L7F22_007296 [Adiantum nelumboides]|nr:hypothetical protein [Adiantum nelumboides]
MRSETRFSRRSSSARETTWACCSPALPSSFRASCSATWAPLTTPSFRHGRAGQERRPRGRSRPAHPGRSGGLPPRARRLACRFLERLCGRAVGQEHLPGRDDGHPPRPHKGPRRAAAGPHQQLLRQERGDCKKQLARVSADLVDPHARPLPFAELRRLLYRSAALAVALPDVHYDLLHYLVSIPIRVFTPAAITTASHVWTWVIGERPLFETKIMVEISLGWATTIKGRKGLFSPSMTNEHPLLRKTEMSPTDRVEMNRERERAQRLFSPHLTLIQLVSSRFQAFRYRDPSMVLAIVRLIQRSAIATDKMSTHPLSREVRFALIVFGFRVIQSSRLDGLVEYQLRLALYKVAFAWFETTPQWSFGSNRLQVAAEMQLMRELLDVLKADTFKAQYAITSFPPSMEGVRMPGHQTVPQAIDSFAGRRALLQLLVEDELSRFSVWSNPINEPAAARTTTAS